MKLAYAIVREYRNWVALAIIGPLILVICVSFGSYYIARDYLKSFHWVASTYQIMDDLNSIQLLLINSESSVRGYILSGDEGFLTPYFSSKEKIVKKLKNLEGSLKDNELQKEPLKEYVALLYKKLDIVDRAVVRRLGKPRNSITLEVEKLRECQFLTDQIQSVARQMREYQLGELQKRHEQSSAVTKKMLVATMIFTVLLSIFSLALIILFYWLKRLHSLVTVCSLTHKILYDGEWMTMEKYLESRFDLNVSHGISEEAARKIIEEIKIKQNSPNGSNPPIMPEV